LSIVLVLLAAVSGAVLYNVVQYIWPGNWVSTSDSQWHIDDHRNFILDAITLHNETSDSLKDFKIGCSVNANSGTTIAVLSGTIHEILPPGIKSRFSGVDLGRTRIKPQRYLAACLTPYIFGLSSKIVTHKIVAQICS
jgi:hypothetical protein